jgi:hypothetical protein
MRRNSEPSPVSNTPWHGIGCMGINGHAGRQQHRASPTCFPCRPSLRVAQSSRLIAPPLSASPPSTQTQTARTQFHARFRHADRARPAPRRTPGKLGRPAGRAPRIRKMAAAGHVRAASTVSIRLRFRRRGLRPAGRRGGPGVKKAGWVGRGGSAALLLLRASMIRGPDPQQQQGPRHGLGSSRPAAGKRCRDAACMATGPYPGRAHPRVTPSLT